MLKKISGLFLGLVVLAGSACVTPTHASSAASIIITSIQAGGSSGAKEEAIVLYNNSSIDVSLTGWCLANKTAVMFACFNYSDELFARQYILPAYSYATIVSREYIQAKSLAEETFSLVYEVTNNSSGSITGSADTISLINTASEVVDSKAWSSSLASGKVWARIVLVNTPDIYASTGSVADWSIVGVFNLPVNQLIVQDEIIEQSPADPEEPGQGSDTTPPLAYSYEALLITELLPNPKGADAKLEFIELYNAGSQAMMLSNVRLRIGIDSAKWHILPEVEILAGEYVAFYNDVVPFTLVNTTGRVQLYYGTIPIGDPVTYESPKEGQAWALIDDEWRCTTVPTPGAINIQGALSESNEKIPAPCAPNQYRNPETGRCRLIASATSTPTPCKAGQERNPETNRCRNIAAATAPTPCKEGYERNLETNRCRKIVKMSDASHGIKGVQDVAGNQPSWYYWVGLIGLVAAVLSYAVWEWREELAAAWQRARSLLSR